MPTPAIRIIRHLKNLPRAGALFVIIAATFLAYLPALRNGFVWDDHALVLRDPLIRSWRLIPEGFRHFLFIDATPSNFYRPIQRLSFVVDYAFWAFNPFGYHLTSVLVHCAAGAALFFLARLLLPPARREFWAFVVALIWSLHPLHTSAVTYGAGRADPLAALFGFAALALGLHCIESPRRERGFVAAAAFACFALALFSKESGLVFLVIWWLLLAVRRVGTRPLVTWTIALALLLGAYVAMRTFAEKTPPPRGRTISLAVQPVLVARAVAEYAGLLVVPLNLQMERDVATRPPADHARIMEQARRREFQTLAGISLLAGLVVWFRWSRTRRREAFVALGAFAIAYLPISNLFPLNASVAEHWLYIPGAFLWLALAASVAPLTFDHPRTHRIILACVAIAATFFAVRTFLRQPDWHDQRRFIERTIQSGGDTARMRVNLGQIESTEGHDEAALEQFQLALARQPDLSFALLGMAAVQVRLGRFEAAREYLRRAEQHPELAVEALHVRAALEVRETGRNSIPLLEEAAKLRPHFWPAVQRYVRALIEQGKLTSAARELGAFLEQQSFRAETWRLLGETFDRMGDPARAREAFAEAARRDVHDERSRGRAGRTPR
jgi:cytochrome c-type biogenesis protein CcmH/NrfG